MPYHRLMDKQESRELLVNAMGSFFAEAKIEAQIAENAGISREEYNRIVENDLELPECIKKYRETNRQRKIYEEKILTHEIKERGELGTILARLDNPQWLKEQTEHTIALLEAGKHIKKVKIKSGDIEYWLTTTMPEGRETIRAKINLNSITLPDVEGIDDFMITHFKSRKGNPLKDSRRSERNRKKKTKADKMQ